MNQPRRILHVISRLDGYGASRPLLDLAVEQAARGDVPVVAALTTANGAEAKLRDGGIAVQVLGSRWPIDGAALVRLRRWQRPLGVDLVHAWDVKALLHAAASGGCAPLVATLGDRDALPGWSGWAVARFRRHVAAFAVADEASRAPLARLGVAAEQIQLIRPGVAPAAAWDTSRADLLAAFSLPAAAPLIAIAGPLERKRHLDDAIWCFELVRVLYPDARLLILGDGPDRGRLERFARQVSEPGCINFLGYRLDAASLLPAIDMYWQLDAPQHTPYELLDAMAAGAPIVASDSPGNRAALRSPQLGRIASASNRAEVARAADELLRDPALARRLGAAAATDAAAHWSLAAALAAYEQLYRRALGLLAGETPNPPAPVTLTPEMP